MKIETTAFLQGKEIPAKYTCQGEDVSPDLQIKDAPKDTVTFALIMDDPDAPQGTFDHWIAWNIPGNTSSIPEGATFEKQGINHFGATRYGGPCPPPGKPHRYFFKLYALDVSLTLRKGATKLELLKAMEGHILEQSELMGTFKR